MLFRRTIKDTVYRCDIHFTIGDLDEFKRLVAAQTGRQIADVPEWRPSLGKVVEYEYDDGVVEYFVWFPYVPTSAGTIVHEAFHLTSQLLRSRHIHLSFDTEEAYAYHLASVFVEFGKLMVTYDEQRKRQRARQQRKARKRSPAARVR